MCLDRVTIRAIFMGRTLARISILPKISRCWVFALCRLIVVWHYFTRATERRADGSLCFQIALAVLFCHTMIGAQLQVDQTRVRICIALIVLSFSCTMIGRLCRLQYLHVIGQTTLDALGNIKILARTCPLYMATLCLDYFAKYIFSLLSLFWHS